MSSLSETIQKGREFLGEAKAAAPLPDAGRAGLL